MKELAPSEAAESELLEGIKGCSVPLSIEGETIYKGTSGRPDRTHGESVGAALKESVPDSGEATRTEGAAVGYVWDVGGGSEASPSSATLKEIPTAVPPLRVCCTFGMVLLVIHKSEYEAGPQPVTFAICADVL